MNKANLITTLSQKTGITKPVVEQIVNATFEEIIDQLKTNVEVTLAGFGTFSAKSRHARVGVNPLKPTERIQMPATIVPKFKAGKTLKDALKTVALGKNTTTTTPTTPTPAV